MHRRTALAVLALAVTAETTLAMAEAPWDSHIPNLLGYPNVNRAAIVGLDGKPWAASAGLTISPDEVRPLVKVLSDPNTAPPKEFSIGGVKYITLRKFDSTLDGKGKGDPGNACSVSKSEKAVVVAIHEDGKGDKPKEGMSQSTSKAATTVRDYLRSIQY